MLDESRTHGEQGGGIDGIRGKVRRLSYDMGELLANNYETFRTESTFQNCFSYKVRALRYSLDEIPLQRIGRCCSKQAVTHGNHYQLHVKDHHEAIIRVDSQES